MTKNHTRKFLQVQGFNLDDETLTELGAWMRWPYVFCASILTVGVALASPVILWTLSAIAIVTGAAFFTGATTTGYIFGGVMVGMATLVATTHICIPSIVFNALFNRKQPQPA